MCSAVLHTRLHFHKTYTHKRLPNLWQEEKWCGYFPDPANPWLHNKQSTWIRSFRGRTYFISRDSYTIHCTSVCRGVHQWELLGEFLFPWVQHYSVCSSNAHLKKPKWVTAARQVLFHCPTFGSTKHFELKQILMWANYKYRNIPCVLPTRGKHFFPPSFLLSNYITE